MDPEIDATSDSHSSVQSLWRNWISWAGMVLSGAAIFAFLFLFVIDQLGTGNAYVGILTWVVTPGFFFSGLALFLFGGWWENRHRRNRPAGSLPRVTIDLSNARTRWRLLYFSVGAGAFLMLTAIGSYETYHVTETVAFCGLVCHTTMEPEYVTYQESPHARVDCVACHVGSGAGAYAKAKLNGVHQLMGVITGDFSRPVPTPVRNLRPSRETCEQCHWPEQHVGNLEKTYFRFLSDEENTPFTVRMLLHVGGGTDRITPAGGIHWHTNSDTKIEYVASDDRRQEIPWVRVTKSDGSVHEYVNPDFEGKLDHTAMRTMDCIDCHNRPAHQFMSPNDAVDEALHLGRIDTSLPSIKRTVVALLTGEYGTVSEAHAAIASKLEETYGEEPKVQRAIASSQDIYKANFFPLMDSSWIAYPDNAGHKDWTGCFRCHDGNHVEVTSQKQLPAHECGACHTLLAQGQGDDLKLLAPAGLEFKHPGDDVTGWLCNDCHEGQNQEM
jgi:nitrate/TMAO reductase-like tetraheme cytochrome c subunit